MVSLQIYNVDIGCTGFKHPVKKSLSKQKLLECPLYNVQLQHYMVAETINVTRVSLTKI